MTPIETMALLVALLAAIKLVVILINPKTWLGVVKKIYVNPILTTLVALVLAIVTLNYLLKELTLVQIFAAMLFFMFLMLLGFAAYSEDMLVFADKLLKNKTTIKKAWLAILVWIILIIWVLKALFF